MSDDPTGVDTPCSIIPLRGSRGQPGQLGQRTSGAEPPVAAVVHEKHVQLAPANRSKVDERHLAPTSVHRLKPTYPIRARHGDWEFELMNVEQLVALMDALRCLGDVPKPRMLSPDGPTRVDVQEGEPSGARPWRSDDIERYLDGCSQSGGQVLRYLAMTREVIVPTSKLADGAALGNRNAIGAVGKKLANDAKKYFPHHRTPIEIRGTKNARRIELDAQFKTAAKEYFDGGIEAPAAKPTLVREDDM